MRSDPSRFDAEYYRRYYLDEGSRVVHPAEHRRLVEFVCAYLAHMEISVRRIYDLGCGIGLWREPLLERYPRAEYVGVEISEHLCDAHGWIRSSIAEFSPDEPADLVICQGVLQYLPAKEARRAIRKLSWLADGALFLEVLTRWDWEEVADQTRTDGEVYLRQGRWYLEQLDPYFVRCGGGVYVPRHSGLHLFELEHLDPDAIR